MSSLKHMVLWGIGAVLLTLMIAPQKSEARTITNSASASTSQRCSTEAERYADRRARRRTAAGVGVGAAAGAIVGGNAGTGALIGGGSQLFRSNSRWRAHYNRSYRECINR